MKLSRHFVALVAAIVVQIAAIRALPAPRDDSLRTDRAFISIHVCTATDHSSIA